VFTPEQIAFQEKMKDYNAEEGRLRAAALDAFAAETAREKAGDCPDAHTTVDINQCLGHEVDVTDTNYKAFAASIRAALALRRPLGPGEENDSSGPTGPAATPATSTAAFDEAETAWQAYRRAECNAIDVKWRGGTIVNSMVGACWLRMTRARMHELDDAYDLSSHP
jgi:uncharacterized protein YecT (DUF1311 family)